MTDNANTTPPSDQEKEASAQFNAAVGLPPKPDAESGQPFPPHAPGYIRADRGRPELDRGRDTKLSQKPTPPPGQGPTLAWYRSSRRKALIFAGALVVVAIGVNFAAYGFSVEPLRVWWIWALALGFAVVMYFSVKVESIAAGAEWVMERKTWVRTYELASIKAYTYSNTLNMHLIDRDGRKLEISIDHLQDDRRIWDLTYNGILHSAVKNGAETNQLARGTLNLPGG